jgi:2-amino-4-hydroxy-6-hydroxymethyldihydropteridine diphosphokinase/dihydropteroate synthase
LKSVAAKFKGRATFSLDSRHPETVERGLEYGIDWINDVSGLQDSQMQKLALRSRGPVVIMHSLSVPARPDLVLPEDVDPFITLGKWAAKTLEVLLDKGIDAARVVLDPGIGFGKTPAQNIYLLRHAEKFHQWGVRLMIGHSRKSYLAGLTPVPPPERDFETALVSSQLSIKGVEILRVHEPALNARALSIHL